MTVKKTKQKKFMQGNEACAEGALYAGCRFYAGYPITPSTEIMEIMAARLPKMDGVFIQMEDEIASISAITGAALGGLKSMTATSGPGFSLMQEGLGYACMTEIPCVIVDVMRSGPSTGYPTGPSQSDVMQAKWGTHGDRPAIVLTPSSVQEILHETIRAFNLSELYRTPVTILYDEVIGHMREAIVIPEPGELEVIERQKPSCSPSEYKPYEVKNGKIAPLAAYGEGYRFHVTGLYHAADGFPSGNTKLIQETNERLVQKVEKNKEKIWKNEELYLDDAEIGVFAYGVSAKSAKFAVKELRSKGIKVGLLRPLTIWPFPDDAVLEMAKKVKTIIVPEMNLGQIVNEVQRASKGQCEIRGIFRVDTDPIHPKQIMNAILGKPVEATIIPNEVMIERDMIDG
ncbi:MAG: 2-oxoglutarate synthase subunit alpha [Deltaproteobacteria bacterium RIFCSPLOWO2_12_FULL_43_16]|nr:MAG: 2-oxoglutarate synthase subunit alpha [Deltaproteobacteria bacterium RIFCSPLOWO2_12_FULL_43_16]